jgi:hypothetical protein
VPWLTTSNVAYINLDVATSGPVPAVEATPDFHAIAIETMKKVFLPYHGLDNVTFYDVWSESGGGEIGVLGSGSDYTAFLHNNGISSIDITSNPGPDDPVYHYHSNYDTFHWMQNFGVSIKRQLLHSGSLILSRTLVLPLTRLWHSKTEPPPALSPSQLNGLDTPHCFYTTWQTATSSHLSLQTTAPKCRSTTTSSRL